MKKRSILLTCIVAVMALAMFVGCDNAPVFPDMPKSVKSGYIVQTGDFLEGQAFDASKFSVVAVLDDGSEKTVTGTTVTGAPVITTGTKLAAVAGYNMDGEQVYAEGTATAYNTDSLTITGPASVTLSAYKELDESDFTVTATYLATNSDGTKESRTMQLATGEINLEGVKYANDVAPTASNPTVSATATISTEMGGYISETYTFEVTYEAPVAELPGPVVGIKSIAYKTGTGEKPAIVAMDDVYPSFDDFDICLGIEGYVGDEDGYKLTADPGIELSYVDSKKQDLNGDLSGLVTGDEVYIKAEFEGYVAYTASTREVTIPTVSFSTSSDFTDNKIITGSELTVPELEDVVVELSYSNNSNTTYIVADPSDVSYVFQDQNNEIITTAPETAGSVVYLKAVYRGVASTQLLPVGTTVAPATVDSIEVTLKADVKGPNKQVYTDASDIPAAETVVASVAINWSDETKQVLDGNFAAWGITFEYVTNPAGSALAIEDGGLDLSVYNGLYVKATYAYAAGEEPITDVSDTAVALQTAYATGISVDVIYDNDPEITEPKYGAIVTYKVYSVNEYGIVAELDSYKIRNSSEALPTNVDSTEHAYTIVVENLQTSRATLEDLFIKVTQQ